MRIVGTIIVACLLALPADATAAEPASPANVTVVLALPDASVRVSIDDREVADDAAVGDILGPFRLEPGSHDVAFSDSAGEVDVVSTVEIEAGTSRDVVLHRPAEEGGAPIVTAFDTSLGPIGAGKARVLLAHTATVAPADVRVDGQVVFTNIANGEYAEAEVPAGDHVVALLPTGQSKPIILGPLDVTLAESTMTMVYAVGSPTTQSMNIVAHTAELASDGSAAPETIDTGEAGLVAGEPVTEFGSAGSTTVGNVGPDPVLWAVVGVVLGLGLLLRRRRARPGGRPASP